MSIYSSTSRSQHTYIYMYRISTLFKQLRDPSGSGTDNCFITVTPVGNELIVSTEGDYVHQIDPNTLNSVERASSVQYNTKTRKGRMHWSGAPATAFQMLHAEKQESLISKAYINCMRYGERMLLSIVEQKVGLF